VQSHYFNRGGCYDFLHYNDMSNDSIASLLMAKGKTIVDMGQQCSGSNLAYYRTPSLKGIWFQVKKEDVDNTQGIDGQIGCNAVFQDDMGFYHVLSLYSKSYNKWRFKELLDAHAKLNSLPMSSACPFFTIT
jgi:hypothetical protein